MEILQKSSDAHSEVMWFLSPGTNFHLVNMKYTNFRMAYQNTVTQACLHTHSSILSVSENAMAALLKQTKMVKLNGTLEEYRYF